MAERIALVGDPTTVYVLRDADENVLYVGMSKNPDGRVACHRRKHWGGEIASVEHQELPHRLLAMVHEVRLIREHRPPNNVQHKPEEQAA